MRFLNISQKYNDFVDDIYLSRSATGAQQGLAFQFACEIELEFVLPSECESEFELWFEFERKFEFEFAFENKIEFKFELVFELQFFERTRGLDVQENPSSSRARSSWSSNSSLSSSLTSRSSS